MNKPEIVASVWKPWRVATWPQFVPLDKQVEGALALGADAIAIKGTNRGVIYGARENFLPTSPYRKYSNDDLEIVAKAQGLGVDLWCWVDLKDPAKQARVVQDATARWNPRNVKIDIEGSIAKRYIKNTGAFLRSLGRLCRHDGTPVKVWLQSYRRPDLHRDKINWRKWLTYTGQDGEYLLDGVAPQAYYKHSQDSIGDYERMLKAHVKLEAEIGRRDLLWHVTLPTFKEHGWYPTAKSLEDGINFLRAELGDRLVGVDYWRLGWLFEKTGREVFEMLVAYDWGKEEPEPEPKKFEELPEKERWEIVGYDLRNRGVINAP